MLYSSQEFQCQQRIVKMNHCHQGTQLQLQYVSDASAHLGPWNMACVLVKNDTYLSILTSGWKSAI